MKKNTNTHLVAGILIVFFVVIFLVITGRFLYIQISGEIDDVSLADWAKEKRMSTYFLHSERGKIIDSNGMILAHDRTKYKMYAVVAGNVEDKKNYKYVEDIEGAAKALAPLLEVEESFILERLNKGLNDKRYQVEFGKVGKNLSKQVRDEIVALKIPGIHFEEEAIRYYPNGEFASHILGFARVESEENEDGDVTEEIKGVTGIENEMNELLSGEDGYISYQRDRYNKKLLDPKEIVKKPVNGNDIYLTIDQKVQLLLEDVMTEVEEVYTPERITAVVMHAKTGEIIAMSNRPSYNPNNPVDVKNWYNDVISTPFEPGSTIKMFTWAAAIDAGVYNGNETFQSGSYKINPRVRKVSDHNQGKGWGVITFDEGFKRSSNVAASKLVWEKIGTDKFLDYLTAFDFDEKTGIDLPGEAQGEILYRYPLEKLTTSFGQGSTVTPIQQVKAATAITNDGKMLQPYVIKKIVNPDTGTILEEKTPQIVGEPISKETADQVKVLLDSVVNSENGTGKPYKLDAYSVMGKTGTAQVPNPEGTTAYLSGHGNNIYSFLGMAPKDDPELIMYVAVNQPKLEPSEQGSAPVAHIFKSVMEHSLHYLNIIPDIEDEDPVKTVEIPKLLNENTASVEKTLKEAGLNVTTIGKGEKIVKASAMEGEELLTSDRLILVTDKPTMPNIIGWSLRDVQKFSALMEFKLEPIGNGYVVTQSIKKGKKIKKDDYLGVELKPPNHSGDNKEAKEAESNELEDESD